jgi:putative PIN family toxin of toxin-antitoxin system
VAEAKDVLNRPVLRAKFTTLTDEAVSQTLNLLADAQQVILNEITAVSRDPKDDIFLATALEAQAHYLVTEDKDLLVLDPHQSIRIVNALAFLGVLQESQANDNP